MSYAGDANVLLYASDRTGPYHESAMAFLQVIGTHCRQFYPVKINPRVPLLASEATSPSAKLRADFDMA